MAAGKVIGVAVAMSITVVHMLGRTPGDVEQALEAAFAEGGRRRLLRLEGTFGAVRARLETLAEEAGYRYLIFRPGHGSEWVPVLETGNHTVGLEASLSSLLDGCAVFTTFVYGEIVSGYRLARAGVDVDHYTSDPSILQSTGEELEEQEAGYEYDYELERGHPERFPDLLPDGTSDEDFTRIVLRPGWWQEHDQAMAADSLPGTTAGTPNTEDEGGEPGEELVDLVDEVDRMRCIALALELFGPSEYPFAQDAEDIPDRVVGPVIALAFV